MTNMEWIIEIIKLSKFKHKGVWGSCYHIGDRVIYISSGDIKGVVIVQVCVGLFRGHQFFIGDIKAGNYNCRYTLIDQYFTDFLSPTEEELFFFKNGTGREYDLHESLKSGLTLKLHADMIRSYYKQGELENVC